MCPVEDGFASACRGVSVWHVSLCSFAGLLAGVLAHAADWSTVEEDGLHDPATPGIALLQDPVDALSVLPPDTAGNHVNWVRALEGGYIRPRSYLHDERAEETLDLDVIMVSGEGASLPAVRFPHKAHTAWLACKNCHESLFRSKAGATPVSMLAILQGEYCGRCHGAVSFPLTECNRCHSVEQRGVVGEPDRKP